MSTVLGRAIATIKAVNANKRNTPKKGYNFTKNDLEPENPSVELIFKVAVCWSLFKYNQAAAAGINNNNQKNSGFKKLNFSINYWLVLVQLIVTFALQWRFRIDRLQEIQS